MSGLPPLAGIGALRAWPSVVVTDDQIPAAEAVLARASSVVRRNAGKTFVDADGNLTDVPDGVAGIVVAAAARFWNNPNARIMLTAGGITEQFSQAIEAGVYLTQTEKDEITASSESTRPKLWTQPTQRDDRWDYLEWLDDGMNGDPFYIRIY